MIITKNIAFYAKHLKYGTNLFESVQESKYNALCLYGN